MQLAPASAPATPPAPTAATPARDLVRPRLSAEVRDLVPDVALDTRIGKGTVASEFDRMLSVRVEGDGPPSKRTIVPQTTAAERVLASKAGPAFEQLVRQTMAVGDAAKGKENLRSITLAPDEHALKAYEFLNRVERFARHTGQAVQFSDSGKPADEKAAAAEFAREISKASAEENSRTLAWNGDGDMLVMPDVSRRLLASLGAYRLQPGDKVLQAPPEIREAILRDDWDTLVHEANHSVTPTTRVNASQLTYMWEEAIPSVLGLQERSRTAAKAGARIDDLVEDPTSGSNDANLSWKGWNRDHMPVPSQEKQQETTATYRDGPQVLRDLLRLTGVDRRTNEGRERTFELLQGKPAEHVPRTIADAIIEEQGLEPGVRERLVDRVRASLAHPKGARHVEELLAR